MSNTGFFPIPAAQLSGYRTSLGGHIGSSSQTSGIDERIREVHFNPNGASVFQNTNYNNWFSKIRDNYDSLHPGNPPLFNGYLTKRDDADYFILGWKADGYIQLYDFPGPGIKFSNTAQIEVMHPETFKNVLSGTPAVQNKYGSFTSVKMTTQEGNVGDINRVYTNSSGDEQNNAISLMLLVSQIPNSTCIVLKVTNKGYRPGGLSVEDPSVYSSEQNVGPYAIAYSPDTIDRHLEKNTVRSDSSLPPLYAHCKDSQGVAYPDLQGKTLAIYHNNILYNYFGIYSDYADSIDANPEVSKNKDFEEVIIAVKGDDNRFSLRRQKVFAFCKYSQSSTEDKDLNLTLKNSALKSRFLPMLYQY